MRSNELKAKYEELYKELAEAGAPSDYRKYESSNICSPLDALVNGPYSAKPFARIILKHANGLEAGGKAFCARVLTEKGLTEAVPFLLSLFDEYDLSEIDLWAVGNALYIIDDKKSYSAILEICKMSRHGAARQMIMGTLARMRTDEAYECLIQCLQDNNLKAHAIEALGRFGRVDAIEVIEKLEVKKGLYENKAKITALKRLRKKLDSNTVQV